MSGATLEEANLSNSDLSRANLSYIDLLNADLSNSNLNELWGYPKFMNQRPAQFHI